MMTNDEFWLTDMEKFVPEPVWRKVLGKLEKKNDIENCSNASLFFGDLLQKKREVVLPKVFGMLAQRYYDTIYANDDSDDNPYKENNIESIPWKAGGWRLRLGEIHRMTGLWKCRLVCRMWNRVIEDIHQNEDAGHYKMQGDLDEAENHILGTEYGREYFGVKYFLGELSVVKFLRHFNGTHYDIELNGISNRKCPFLGRSIKFHYFCENEFAEKQAYWKFIEMLENFGQDVWYFQFLCENARSVVEHVGVYKVLREIVELMPNLKVLRVDYTDSSQSRKELQHLMEEIERHPFPTLVKLEMMSFKTAPGPVSNHLVNQNRQISRLEVQKVSFDVNYFIFGGYVPNLTHLSLRLNTITMFEAFESCQFKFSLVKCYLNLEDIPSMRWSRVFTAIQSKLNLNSCTDLKLKMAKPRTDWERKMVLMDSLSCRLGLAKIERFEISVASRFCLDFLLPSKDSLKIISVSCDPNNVYNQHNRLRYSQVIKFFGYEDNMQESNVAKEVPNLKKLQVGVEGCNFRDYYVDPNGVLSVREENEVDSSYGCYYDCCCGWMDGRGCCEIYNEGTEIEIDENLEEDPKEKIRRKIERSNQEKDWKRNQTKNRNKSKEKNRKNNHNNKWKENNKNRYGRSSKRRLIVTNMD